MKKETSDKTIVISAVDVARVRACIEDMKSNLEITNLDKGFYHDCVIDNVKAGNYLEASFELDKICSIVNIEENIGTLEELFPKERK